MLYDSGFENGNKYVDYCKRLIEELSNKKAGEDSTELRNVYYHILGILC